MLSPNEVILVCVILGALVLILSNRIRADWVAIMVLLALALTGVVSFDEAKVGFSSSVVIIIIGLFIITHALEDTGVVQWIAERLKQIGQGSEARLILLFMGTGAALSLIMSTVAAAAMLLPAAVQVGRESRVSPSKLLIPLSFGTLVGGMATYFTTAHIIISSILRDQGLEGLTMTDFLPAGSVITIAGLAYMTLIGRRLLPTRKSVGQAASPYLLSRKLFETYHLDERLWEVSVLPDSRLVDVTLDQSQIGESLGLTVVAIWHGQNAVLNPEPDEVIRTDDHLLVLGRKERVQQLATWGTKVGRTNGWPNGEANERDYTVDLTEVVVSPRSSVIGKTLTDLHFRKKFGLTTVALWRENRSYRTDVGKMPLEAGDALLMVGSPTQIRALADERDFIVLESGHAFRPPLPQKARWAVLITALVLAASILEIVPAAEAALIGAVAVVLTGSINVDDAYRVVEWRVIFLIVGMLPISTAMIKTGLAARIGAAFVTTLQPFGPLALVAGLSALAVFLTQILGGQVVGLIIGPIAITAALQVGVNPQAMAVAVANACSAGFLLPIAHPVNVLMMGPGGYTFGDFLKVGVGMTLVTFVALLIGMSVFWGV
ncbi:MAG: SLC13 family permease [Anaerolineae bacterium]